MNLLVLGASGKTGQEVVKQALANGYNVTAFVRDPAKLDIKHDNLTVKQGDVADSKAIDEAIAGQDAIINTVGHIKGSPADIQTRSTKDILATMQKHGVKRIVTLAGAGVKDNQDPQSLGATFVRTLMKVVAKPVLEDATNYTNLLKAAPVEWVVVRPPRLQDGPHTGQYRTGYLALGPSAKITRADVADFMLKNVQTDAHLRSMPMISY